MALQLTRSPLNLECLFAMAILLAVLLRAQGRWREAAPPQAFRWLPLAAALALTAAAFAPTLGYFFTGDDFFVVVDAYHGLGHDFLRRLGFAPGDIFYRPFAYWFLTAAAHALALDPLRWHAFCLGLHLLNCALLYAIALRLGLRPWTAALGALLFGIHASRPESAVWVTGCFELISAAGVFLCLLFYLRGWRTAALTACLLALWSKESAYTIPFLLLLLPWSADETWRHRLRAVAPFWLLAAAAFVHRWWILGGMGGYQAAHPAPDALRLVKLLFARLWAPLFFPVNWSVPAGLFLLLALALLALALIFAVRYPLRRPLVLFALAGTALSALPAATQLLIGADLQKARLLYLPSAWFVLLLAGLAAAVPARRWSAGVSLVVILFHAAALRHNLAVWREVTELARRTSATAAEAAAGPPGEIIAVGLPDSIHGVYFFANGFDACLTVQGRLGWRATHLQHGPAPAAAPGRIVLEWHGAQARLLPADR